MVKIKQDIYDQMSQQRELMEEKCIKVDDEGINLKHKIVDLKFWLETYTKSHKELDVTMNSLKAEMKGDYEKAIFAIDQKLETRAFRENMNTLNTLMNVKFKQVEDVKDGLRNMLVY